MRQINLFAVVLEYVTIVYIVSAGAWLIKIVLSILPVNLVQVCGIV